MIVASLQFNCPSICRSTLSQMAERKEPKMETRTKKVTLLVIALVLLLPVVPVLAQESTTITLLHFSDYHSHAVPFYSEGQDDSAGIARAMAYLKGFADDPNALIFSGGDMMNRGTPAWSDKYQCAEWPWFNGIVDAMAYGNHDSDYGPQVFADCLTQIDYPILGANVLDATGQPLFQQGGKTYQVFEVDGVKIGVFAVAGDEYERLIKAEYRPAEDVTFAERVATARDVVQTLRDEEGVDAVIVIGHASYEDDLTLAESVSGIDVILGTHSHRKQELTQIPGTETFIISPYQYLTYVNKVELTFTDGELSDVSGSLVRMGASLPEDAETAQKVVQMQADLEADPEYASLFESIGTAAIELSNEGQNSGESLLGNFVMDIFRAEAGSHMAVSTASSFRQPIPPGEILEEDLRTALPYTNMILVFEMTGEQVQELLDYSASLSGSDSFSQVSGVRFGIAGGKATGVQILNDPVDPVSGYSALDPAATYQVATTDYQGLIASGYSDIFAQATHSETGIDVREKVRAFIQANSPVTAKLDGRIIQGTAAAELPETGAVPFGPPIVLLMGTSLVALGLLTRRKTGTMAIDDEH
jgi:5'-nucleotidase